MLMDLSNWKKNINKLRSEIVPTTKENLKKVLIDSVNKLIPNEKFGVLLSGGIDSSLIACICKKKTDDFICYSVGLKGSPDIKAAELLAEKFNLNLKVQIINAEEVPKLLKEVKSILNNPDIVDIGVGCVDLAAGKLAKEDNINFIFSGLGSDELLAGYDSFLKADNIENEAWKRITHVDKDLKRGLALANKLKIKVLFPFLERHVIKIAMGLPSDLKLKDDIKKYVLRLIAEELGLPDEIAWRKKKAAQYGSNIDKIITKLAKKNKMYKKEFIDSL